MSSRTDKRFITIGEIMMRLTPPDYGRFRAADQFQIHYGGSEANIALSLASLGIDSTFFTVVPDHALGRSAIGMLKSFDVDCSPVIYSTSEETPTHRLGVYYLETGYGMRSSQVIYDRANSAITEYDFSKVDIKKLLDGYTWLHLSGITAALNENCRAFVLNCLKTAKELGITVSFDGNFRSKLWSWEEARDFCTQCLPYVDVLFGIEPYHLWKDVQHPECGDVKDDIPYQPTREEQKVVFDAFFAAYPNLQCIARHVRYAESGSVNSLKAYIGFPGEIYETKKFTFEILDRVGGGDAFAAGFIYAMIQDFPREEAGAFAVAASVLKHTIHGDANIIESADTIAAVMKQNYDIKR